MPRRVPDHASEPLRLVPSGEQQLENRASRSSQLPSRRESPSKARTIRARVTLARRCPPRSPHSSTKGDPDFARPGTRRWPTAPAGLDAKRSKIDMVCLCALFVPDGSASIAGWRYRSRPPHNQEVALWCDATMPKIDRSIVLRHIGLGDIVPKYNESRSSLIIQIAPAPPGMMPPV